MQLANILRCIDKGFLLLLLLWEMLTDALKGIGLGSVFRNFLWEKKKITDFFDNFLYFP